MLEKDFDQLLRHRLADHSSDVPGDMWMRIRIKEKRRRVLLFWRWYLAGFLLLTLLITAPAPP